MPTTGEASTIISFLNHAFTGYIKSNFEVFRLKAAEETFRLAREKATYNIKPKHATGIVSVVKRILQFCLHILNSDISYIMINTNLIVTRNCFPFLPFRKPSWDRRCEFLCYLIATKPMPSIIHTLL